MSITTKNTTLITNIKNEKLEKNKYKIEFEIKHAQKKQKNKKYKTNKNMKNVYYIRKMIKKTCT